MIIDTDTIDVIIDSFDGTVPGTHSISRMADNTKLALAVHIATRIAAKSRVVDDRSKRREWRN